MPRSYRFTLTNDNVNSEESDWPLSLKFSDEHSE